MKRLLMPLVFAFALVASAGKVPNAPENLTASKQCTSGEDTCSNPVVLLTWTDAGGSEKYYVIERAVADNKGVYGEFQVFDVLDRNSESWIDLWPEFPAKYRVSAWNRHGEGAAEVEIQ